MIQVIAGKKGSGKTKRIIDMANQASQESKHDIVFIDELDGKPLTLKVYCLYRTSNKNSNVRKLAEALANQSALG